MRESCFAYFWKICILALSALLPIFPFRSGPVVSKLSKEHSPGECRLVGECAELLGLDEFDPRVIQSRLESLLIGSYPYLTQCIVLQKPAKPR